MIEVKSLVKSFDGFNALDGATLKIENGSVYGLMGPNGAGKTTLLRHITGVYRQNEGEVLIDGENVWENVAVKARIASIPDDWFFYGQATIKEMMQLYKGLYPSFSVERYNVLKEAFPIDENKNIKYLSKGMQKQVAFMLSIAARPELMILDEPVDGLDPVMRRQIWSLLMQDVTERQVTVLVSSHNLRELEDVCDTVGIMNQGKMLLEKSLFSMQEGITKLQVAFKDNNSPEITEESIDGVKLLSNTKNGSVFTLIVKCSEEEIKAKMSKYEPLLLDTVPLTLEEIFIHELGGEQYGIKEIIL